MPSLTIDLDNITAEQYLAIQEAVKGKIVITGWKQYSNLRQRDFADDSFYAVIVYQAETTETWRVLYHADMQNCEHLAPHYSDEFPTPEAAQSAVDTFLAQRDDVRAVGVERKGE